MRVEAAQVLLNATVHNAAFLSSGIACPCACRASFADTVVGIYWADDESMVANLPAEGAATD